MALAHGSLADRFASVLPNGFKVTIHHLSSYPTPCPELFAAPPDGKPEATTCESHFLSVSINHDASLVQIFAIEVLVYRTETLTTLFVSKADSTGYLHLLDCLKPASSPIKAVIGAFLEYLVETKRRKDRRLLLSLFARSQNQYLFPGSIENPKKHVLDDRGLIRWWCKIFDSILQKYPAITQAENGNSSEGRFMAQGYLTIPGCDRYETAAFLPKPIDTARWLTMDPLRSLGKSPAIPERCIIPRFPDDPKARFVIDLDDELPENGPQPQNSPAKNPHPGKWRSVRTLEQFWELMAFRQECAAGRLVGFIWAVFEPLELKDRPFETSVNAEDVPNLRVQNDSLPTPQPSQAQEPIDVAPSSPRSNPPPKLPLSPGPSSQAQDQPSDSKERDELLRPTSSNRMEPVKTRDLTITKGEVIVDEDIYKRCIDVLSTLDYANLDIAKESSTRFFRSTSDVTHVLTWSMDVTGTKVDDSPISSTGNTIGGTEISMLGQGLIRRKNKRPVQDPSAVGDGDAQPKTLDAGLVRKKPKV